MTNDLLLLNIQALTTTKCDVLFAELISNNIKFLCLTETWCTATSAETFNFPGYNLAAFFSRNEFKGGGVGIWSRSDLQVTALNISSYCHDKHFEICGVTWDNGVRVFLFTCYRSPGSDFNFFCNKLCEVLDMFYKSNAYVVICGDFNVDPIRDRGSFDYLKHILGTYNLTDKVKTPTRDKNILDNVFTNIPNTNFCTTEEVTFSDHNVVYCDGYFKRSTGMTKKPVSQKRIYNETNVANFINDISSEDWGRLYPGLGKIHFLL
ncbi:hypothetical protein Zmor_014784 [Zophobas morio]|uniref:Endonuclease/exonuclease/phosphatase domain-containing protein n=1 Tax=Zophobas morio TaxID=2755281 RepID=A0AA38ID44_9CUCU|nr:hypothetical protein Zmor_014784 [Zophobas morio]